MTKEELEKIVNAISRELIKIAEKKKNGGVCEEAEAVVVNEVKKFRN